MKVQNLTARRNPTFDERHLEVYWIDGIWRLPLPSRCPFVEASLSGLGSFRIRPRVGTKLFCSIRVSAGAASPLGVWSGHDSLARAAPATFAGTEGHHQIATAFQTLSLGHGVLLL